jgi:hypothetical protein
MHGEKYCSFFNTIVFLNFGKNYRLFVKCCFTVPRSQAVTDCYLACIISLMRACMPIACMGDDTPIVT